MSSGNWLPTARAAQLAMCRNWIEVLTTGNKAFAWGVPASRVTSLETAADNADAALARAMNETTRTAVVNAQCRAAFHAMVELMQDTKRRYFLSPPLTEADFVSLGLKPRDTTYTHGGVPTSQAKAEPFLAGRQQLGIRIEFTFGDPKDKANKGFRVYTAVRKPGESAPVDPKEFVVSFFTMRMKDLVLFEPGDSGSTAYFVVQVENDGKKGTWGQITSAIIP
jgi:hypothetical protein